MVHSMTAISLKIKVSSLDSLQRNESSLSNSPLLDTINRALALHIEHNSFTPMLMKKFLERHIDQIDPEKIYFLEPETPEQVQRYHDAERRRKHRLDQARG